MFTPRCVLHFHEIAWLFTWPWLSGLGYNWFQVQIHSFSLVLCTRFLCIFWHRGRRKSGLGGIPLADTANTHSGSWCAPGLKRFHETAKSLIVDFGIDKTNERFCMNHHHYPASLNAPFTACFWCLRPRTSNCHADECALDLFATQGNGNSVLFQNEPRVFTFSMHCRSRRRYVRTVHGPWVRAPYFCYEYQITVGGTLLSVRATYALTPNCISGNYFSAIQQSDLDIEVAPGCWFRHSMCILVLGLRWSLIRTHGTCSLIIEMSLVSLVSLLSSVAATGDERYLST